MRRERIRRVLSAIVAFQAVSCFGATVDVFFVGGQSNATTYLRDGIANRLTSSGLFTNLQVVYINHPGAGLDSWYNSGQRQANYLSDFYNPAPDAKGAMESALDAISAAGNTYRIRDLFWFQGESDISSPSLYANKFNVMLGQVSSDLNRGAAVPFTVALIQANPNDQYMTPALYSLTQDLRAVQKTMATDSPVGTWADSGIFPRGDAWHLSNADAVTFGGMMADAYVASVPEPISIGTIGIFCALALCRPASRSRSGVASL